MAHRGRGGHKQSGTQCEWMDLVTLRDYAAISDRTLRGWIHRSVNPLPAVRVEKKLLVNRDTFDGWLQAHIVASGGSTNLDALVTGIMADLRGGAR